MKNRNKIVLKGQQNLAQGNRRRSVALGWRRGIKIVRAIMLNKSKILFRTREMTLCFYKMMSCNSVRMELLTLFIESSRTVFLLNPFPRAAFRIVPPETLPWAILYWPFRPEKDSDIDLSKKYKQQKIKS
jgi:hypothetical protein